MVRGLLETYLLVDTKQTQKYRNLEMVITEAKYTADIEGNNAGVFCQINGVETNVPIDENNRHYAEILRQVEAGELTIQEAD